MTPLVPSIVEVLMNKIALWISNPENYWTAKSAIIASNGIWSDLKINRSADKLVNFTIKHMK